MQAIIPVNPAVAACRTYYFVCPVTIFLAANAR